MQPARNRPGHAMMIEVGAARARGRGTMMMRLGLLVLGATLAHAHTPPQPCATTTSFPWCDTSKNFSARAQLLVASLTPDEKSGLFASKMSAIPRIFWPEYNWWSEALHGVARDGVATSFPQIGLVGSSLNRSLWHAIADATSTEGRGKNNGLLGGLYQGLTFWAPNVNIFRDPRWGRGQETPGEDPLLNAEYAVQFISGMQGDESSGYLKVSACLKHYAAYSAETGRESFAAVVTAQDMEDSYLPAFQAGVERGKASGLMCSYNAETYGYGVNADESHRPGVQGGAIPSCANKFLMNDLVRGDWGFDGYITSDW
jgi:beta-glucosidase